MQQIELKAIGRKVSCLGFGCARLDGRIGLRRSTALLETALELGITYFDVAAGYGTAEEALGHVIGNSQEVVVTTKVGPPRQAYNARKMRVKATLKPVLDQVRSLKMLLRGAVHQPPNPANRPRYDFSLEAIQRSLETSLKNLQRDAVDIFLAHEPHREDLIPETAGRFQSLVDQGLARAYGVGVDVREDRWASFGSVWQSGWPGEAVEGYGTDASYIFHGVLRYAEKDRYGRSVVPVSQLLQAARRQAPGAVLLVSASTPGRLREVVQAVQQAN